MQEAGSVAFLNQLSGPSETERRERRWLAGRGRGGAIPDAELGSGYVEILDQLLEIGLESFAYFNAHLIGIGSSRES